MRVSESSTSPGIILEMAYEIKGNNKIIKLDWNSPVYRSYPTSMWCKLKDSSMCFYTRVNRNTLYQAPNICVFGYKIKIKMRPDYHMKSHSPIVENKIGVSSLLVK